MNSILLLVVSLVAGTYIKIASYSQSVVQRGEDLLLRRHGDLVRVSKLEVSYCTLFFNILMNVHQ